MTILDTLFKWPDGIVVGNLIASALWATPVSIGFLRKMHNHLEEIREMHRNHIKHVQNLIGGRYDG